MSDIDPEVLTRPDIRAALVSDDEGRSSGLHQRVERVLVPYSAVPVLTSRLNEPTVPDAALRVSMAKARAAEEHTPSQASVPPLSGTREQLASTVPPPDVASTVPPPQRARAKRPATPVPTSTKRPAIPVPTRAAEPPRREEATPAPPAAVHPAALPVARESHLHAYVLIVVTAVSAAAVGVGLGNGSLARFGTRLHTVFIEGDTPAPLVSTQAASPRALPVVPAAANAPAPLPRARASAEDPAKVPFVRLDQLPPTEPEPEPTEAESTDAKRADAKRADAKRADAKRAEPRSAEAKRAHKAPRR